MALRSLLCLALFLLLVSCSSPAAPDPAARPGPGSESAESASREMLVPLTHEASELRRIRDEHAALIRSIPPTPEATPTLTPAERSLVAMARVRRHPEAVPVPPRVGEDWFNPELGLEFYRDSGGDWTPRRVRESHPHRDLLYFSNYPESVPNFTAGSIDDHLARELVFEAVAVLPLLGEPTPAMGDGGGFFPTTGVGAAGLSRAGGQPVDHLRRPAGRAFPGLRGGRCDAVGGVLDGRGGGVDGVRDAGALAGPGGGAAAVSAEAVLLPTSSVVAWTLGAAGHPSR